MEPGSRRSARTIEICPDDAGGRGGRGRSASVGAAVFVNCSTNDANSARSPASRTSRTPIAFPVDAPMRAEIRVASSDEPPSASRSSYIDGSSMPTVCETTCATSCSAGVCAARWGRWLAVDGCGNASRSSLPEGVTGSALNTTTWAGHIDVGRRLLRCLRMRVARRRSSTCEETYNASASASPEPTTTATAWCTSGCVSAAIAISPGSILTPRICTWSSLRPA